MATWQVTASSDDCRRRLSDNAWSLTGDSEWAGGYDAATFKYGCGMRFQNITIPQGATIVTAKLTFRSDGDRAGSVCRTRISAEDVDDAATFADNAGAFDTRWAARTTAIVDWDNIENWTNNSDYDSPSIVAVIQEIVDRALWVSGNDIVLFWEDFDKRTTIVSGAPIRVAYSKDSAGQVPILTITWGTTVYKALISTATGVSALTKTMFNSLTATATGIAVLTKVITFLKILSPTALGVAGLSKISTFVRVLAVTATGIVSLTKASSLYRTLSATATALPTLVKGMFLNLTATITGKVGIITHHFGFGSRGSPFRSKRRERRGRR